MNPNPGIYYRPHFPTRSELRATNSQTFSGNNYPHELQGCQCLYFSLQISRSNHLLLFWFEILAVDINVKGTVNPKPKIHIFPLSRGVNFPFRLFWCELQSFGAISCGGVSPLSTLNELDVTWPVEFRGAKSLFYNLNSNVSFQKSWPSFSRKSTDLFKSSFMQWLFFIPTINTHKQHHR